MKKLMFIAVLLMSGIMFLQAQESLFVKGDKVVNAGIGIGSTLYTGSYYKSTIPPLSVSFEKGIVDNILEKGVVGVGGYLGFASYKWDNLGWGWKYSNFILGARGTFHYPLVDKLDTYTGLMLGYQVVSSKEFGTLVPGYDYNSSTSGFISAWFVGGRYYFSEKFAAMAELGYGITYLNLGIAIKL